MENIVETDYQRVFRLAVHVCTEQQIEALAAYLQHGSNRTAARSLGLPLSTFRARRENAARLIRRAMIEEMA